MVKLEKIIFSVMTVLVIVIMTYILCQDRVWCEYCLNRLSTSIANINIRIGEHLKVIKAEDVCLC